MSHEQKNKINLDASTSEDQSDAPFYEITDADEIVWATASAPPNVPVKAISTGP